MARINVEDSLYKDARFYDLLQKMGGIDAALGALVRAWSVAQDYWLVNRIGIPLPVWKSQKLRPEILEVDLAEIRGDFVYLIGSEEQFAWLDQRSDAGRNGGIASGITRRTSPISMRTSPSEIIEESAKRNEAGRSGAKPLTLTLSHSLSHSHSQEEELKDSSQKENIAHVAVKRPRARVSKIPTEEKSVKQKAKSTPAWEAYSEVYRKRYTTDPVRNKTVNLALCKLVERLGAEEAPQVAAFFVTHNDGFYIKTMHPVWLLARDAEKLRTEWATGNKITSGKAFELERKSNNYDVVQQAIARAEEIERAKNGQG